MKITGNCLEDGMRSCVPGGHPFPVGRLPARLDWLFSSYSTHDPVWPHSSPEDRCQTPGGLLMVGQGSSPDLVSSVTSFHGTRLWGTFSFKIHHIRKFLHEKRNEKFHQVFQIIPYNCEGWLCIKHMKLVMILQPISSFPASLLLLSVKLKAHPLSLGEFWPRK